MSQDIPQEPQTAIDYNASVRVSRSQIQQPLPGLRTAADWHIAICEKILARHAHRGPLFFELRIGTGWGRDSEQRIDAFAMDELPSQRLRRWAYEIKVSRNDFLRELKDPLKRRPALRYSNHFAFVTPPGIARPAELPLECGLVEVGSDGTWRTVVPAPWRDGYPPTWLFFAAVARRLKALPEAPPA